MQSQSYQVLLIGEDLSRTKAYVQLLQDAEGVSFNVRTETNWQSALQGLVSGAPDSSLPDAILWELTASGAVAMTALKNATSLQRCVPFVLLVPEVQKQLAKQFLDAGVSEYLVLETLNKELFQRALRYAVERNRAENSVRQWEKRFEDLFENTKDILFTMTLEGNVTSLNKTAEEVIGWPRSEVLEKNIKDFVAPEHASLCNKVMRSIVSEAPLQHFEIAMLRKDARKVLLEVSAHLIRSNERKDCIQGIARDVTERRQLEKMVRQSQKLEAIGRLSG